MYYSCFHSSSELGKLIALVNTDGINFSSQSVSMGRELKHY